MPRVSRRIAAVAVFVIASLLGACQRDREDAGPGGPGGQPANVAVVTIEPQRAVLTAQLPGRTSPFAVSDVRPQVNGILKARLFTEGSLVQAGQPLYQIDDTLYAAALDSAKAKLASAKAALATATLKAERYTALRTDKSDRQQDDEDAHAAQQHAAAEVAQKQAASRPRASTSATPRSRRRSAGGSATRR